MTKKTSSSSSSSSRPTKNDENNPDEDDNISRDQTDNNNFIHKNCSNLNELMIMMDENSSSILGMTIGHQRSLSATINRANALKRRFGKSNNNSCQENEETEEDSDQDDDDDEDEEDEGMDEPIEGDEDEVEPGQMDLSVAAAAAALNYSQLTKFHFLCPHCGCPFINEDQLKDHIEEEVS